MKWWCDDVWLEIFSLTTIVASWLSLWQKRSKFGRRCGWLVDVLARPQRFCAVLV